MKSKNFFPIRVKILLATLFIVTAVVSAITYQMSALFHQDKKTYIHDLTSLVAMGTSAESRTILSGYEDRLRVLGRTMTSESLDRKQRTELLTAYFQEFAGLVGIVVYGVGEEATSVFDTNALGAAGIVEADILSGLAERPFLPAELVETRRIVENRTVADALPMLALAIPLDEDPANPKFRSVVGLVKLDALQRLVERSQVFHGFVVDRNGKLLAHSDPAALAAGRVELPVQRTDLTAAAAITREFSEADTPMIGGYADPRYADLTVGVQIPQSAAFLASREILKQLTTVALLLLVAAAVIGMVGARRLTRPVDRLVQATRKIGRGEFDVRVEVSAADEIGALSDSFNQMVQELNTRDEKLEAAQGALVQSEKMAAFGQLGAGVAHEVKNPLAGILGCAQLSLRKAEEGTRLHRNLSLIEKETKRCKEIVENLLRFARQEKAVLELTDVEPILRDTAAIVTHQLEINGVKLHVDHDPDLPRIQANANQLQQVLINLVVNGQQAMGEEGGNVRVKTQRNE
ncbi:MAG: HAMP domain-containing protein, partial [Gemmatimonadetes bacterium]|nr:HAMP domain-containing protein [Gemmatimonadota bacterium]